ncbi:hypothetical protein KUV62_22470 [Salipiger bermudensis]|uniref:hypothetical protein n=1 Tax=Salipiger bermudensis TaxID=344736 RepID=UPI001C98F28A|nr:hypothetical protein [Salipiger bermudensis]MBY6006705.1 hypothetical protein [Salipiger bermudensis]
MFLLVAKIFQLSIGGIVIGAMAVTLTISFAALIYTGPLAPYLGNGANFALLGAGLMAAIGAFTYSIEGSIANPQDATAVVLGAAAVGIASTSTLAPDALFPTVLALLVAGCLVAGGVVFLAGLLHLGSLVRYT